jgi:hypothetical protein
MQDSAQAVTVTSPDTIPYSTRQRMRQRLGFRNRELGCTSEHIDRIQPDFRVIGTPSLTRVPLSLRGTPVAETSTSLKFISPGKTHGATTVASKR